MGSMRTAGKPLMGIIKGLLLKGSLQQGAVCNLLNSYLMYFHCVLDRTCFDYDWMIRQKACILNLQLTLIWDSL